MAKKILQAIFSVGNTKDASHKVVNICGIRLKFRRPEKKMTKEERDLLYDNLRRCTNGFNNVIVYFDHNLGGGTDFYFWNQVRDLDEKSVIIRIQYKSDNAGYMISVNGNPKDAIFDADLESVAEQLNKLRINEVNINNIVKYPSIETVFNAVKYLKHQNNNLRVKFSLHDYYAICPNYTLTGNNGFSCKGYCENPDKLSDCIKIRYRTKIPQVVEECTGVTEWREQWKDFFINYVDEIKCFSPSSQSIFENIYPELKSKTTLLPHKFLPFKNSIHAGVLGHINAHKGAFVIDDLLNWLDEHNIWDVSLYVLGKYCGKYVSHPKLKVAGEYERWQLPSLINTYNIDMIFIPSVWDETFSYTTQEAINLRLSVLCLNYGGQADQVHEYNKGCIINSQNPEMIYHAIKETYALNSDNGENPCPERISGGGR